MHADALDIDVDVVRRIVSEQFPQWAKLSIREVRPRGTDNANFRLGEVMVVRLPRRERAAATLAKERRWLPRLAPLLPVSIPNVVATGMAAGGFPFDWAIYTWIDGRAATPDNVADTDQLAHDLVRFLSALERLDHRDGPGPGEHNFFRGAPLAQRDGPTRTALASLAARVDVDAVVRIWDDALAAPPWSADGVWIHGDLDARNVLVDVRGRLTGVIDFGGLAVGDPAVDVMVAWKILDSAARSTFRAELEIDDATWTRARGWVSSQAVIALARYTEETNPTLVTEATAWLAAVLADSEAK